MDETYLATIYSGFDALDDTEYEALQAEMDLNNFMDEVADVIEAAFLEDFGF